MVCSQVWCSLQTDLPIATQHCRINALEKTCVDLANAALNMTKDGRKEGLVVSGAHQESMNLNADPTTHTVRDGNSSLGIQKQWYPEQAGWGEELWMFLRHSTSLNEKEEG